MKKRTLVLAVFLTISGCAEINQHLEAASKTLKDLGKKNDPTNHELATQSSTEKDVPTISMETYTVAAPITDARAPAEPMSKPTPLNITNEKEDLATKDKLIKDTEKTTILVPKKPTSTPEAKQEQPNEHISLGELNSLGWQINKINLGDSFQYHPEHWIFNFSNTGKYKAFGACNFITGNFKAGDDGSFRLGQLQTSSSDCNKDKDEETAIFNLLLMADNFALKNDTLVLKSGNKALIELSRTTKEINGKIAHPSHSKKDGKKKKKSKDSSAHSNKNTKHVTNKDKNATSKKSHSIKKTKNNARK